MAKFGEVSWSDDFGSKKATNNRDAFLKLDSSPNNSNEMRLITQPFQYLVHKYKMEGEKGFGRNVLCSAVHGSCPVCNLGDKAKTRWLLGVIDRKTNAYKVLDISFAVFSQIQKLARNVKSWGDPTKYDIDIVVDKNGGPTGYYSVQPVGKAPLSAVDQQLMDSVDLEDLKRRVTPPTVAQVQSRLDKIHADAGMAPAVQAPTASTAKKVTAQVSNVVDEEDEDFPDYSAK